MARVAALLSVVWQCNDIVPTISAIIFAQASAMQAQLFRGLTDNDVSFQYFCRYFFSPPPSMFLIQEVLGSKNLFKKRLLEHPITWGEPLSGPLQPFCGPLAAIFNFTGGS